MGFVYTAALTPRMAVGLLPPSLKDYFSFDDQGIVAGLNGLVHESIELEGKKPDEEVSVATV